MKVELTNHDGNGVAISIDDDQTHIIIESNDNSDTYFWSLCSLKEIENAIKFLKENGQTDKE